MGNNNAFDPTNDPNAQLPKAITLPLLKSVVQAGKKIAWYWNANLAVGYDPFLVYVWKIDAATETLEFSFVDCADGTLPPNPSRFSAPLKDIDTAHASAPSTALSTVTVGDADVNKNSAVVFLMLNPQTMASNMRNAASDANQPASTVGQKGKWPGTAKMDGQRLIKSLLDRLEKAGISSEELTSFREQASQL